MTQKIFSRWGFLSAVTLGTLFAVGCTSESSSTSPEEEIPTSSSSAVEGESSDSESGTVEENSSSSAEGTALSAAVVIDTANRTVTYPEPSCTLEGSSAVYNPAANWVTASYVLSGDSLYWDENDGEDAIAFAGDNGGSLFGLWTARFDAEEAGFDGVSVKMKISSDALERSVDLSEACMGDAILEQMEVDSTEETVVRTDCNHFSYSMESGGVNLYTMNVSVTPSTDAISIVYAFESSLFGTQSCEMNVEMAVLTEDRCTVENLQNGYIDEDLYAKTVSEDDCASLTGEGEAKLFQATAKALRVQGIR